MRDILHCSLIASAQKLFRQRPPERWWLLWNNSPTHKALVFQTWLHNH
jgi:hypothetical protein